ncbi:sucrose phosphorylase [Pontiella agarivorans]|uniref:Sucrose phosphorylase n=1 Tax=Pontiella agarivorans TaxID=3038953 RepID=A0ABU5MU81_9BACT|nr:sucrose phosphorylase [Pontiella agarivorans]MDZ8117661.1 sucrose phosphorylase [Pontiella agarivorans]
MNLQNKVQLITYPDSLGGNLLTLHYCLRKYFADAIGGVHILPFYPSSADRGFAPINYAEVDEQFGTWEDIEKIGADFDLMIDFMVNHISRQSAAFQDYLELGPESEFADLFLSFQKFGPEGISDEDLAKVYTRKPRPPYLEIQRPDGSNERIWCTFDYEQIDLDWSTQLTRTLMRNELIRLSRTNAKMIRLDAFAYTTVEIGTDCFFREPAVWELLNWLKDCVEPFGTDVLPEVHEHYNYQLKLQEKGYWCYDFALPMLMLHALYHHTGKRLIKWLQTCPTKQFTTLDTHDGIGIVDVQDLLSPEEIDSTVEGLYEKGSNAKKVYSGPEYQNLDLYQINCTYYSALNHDDDAYIAARAIQFFAPGIPQVYYVGLLAGENDTDLVEQTRNGRDINRHNYSIEEISQQVSRPVVQRLLKLMEFRNTHPAFDGPLFIPETPDDRLEMVRKNGIHSATLSVDLRTHAAELTHSGAGPAGEERMTI